MKFLRYTLIVVIISLLAISTASAVEAGGVSSGTMVAAALETVGYHTQAAVLKDLETHFNYLGGLIYLGVIVTAIFTVAMNGSYRPALWILVGPAVFIFASGIKIGGVEHTANAQAVEWRFGAFDDNENKKDELLESRSLEKNAKVSWVFHEYNVLVSEVMQKLISIATEQDIATQMIFMARQRTIEDLFGTELKDSKLFALQTQFLVSCDTEISDARFIAVANRDPSLAQDPRLDYKIKRYCDRFDKDPKALPPGPAMDYIYELDDDPQFTVGKDEWKEKYRYANQFVTCKQLWGWVLQGTRKAAQSALESTEITVPYYGWKLFGAGLYDKVVKDTCLKVTDENGVEERKLSGKGDPCADGTGNADAAAALSCEANAFEVMTNVIAGKIITKTINNSPSQEILQRGNHGKDGVKPLTTAQAASTQPTTKAGIIRRQKAHEFAVARKYEAFTLLMLLPYIQGLLLYGLAVIYPFFALMIILPGQAGSFFSWMALWAWAKSWDVGWALVMTADKIIWELLPKEAYFNPQNSKPYENLASLLETAYDGDPSYNIATYWMLLSMMISGVPIVSAQVVMGSKKAIAGVMLQGVQDIAGNYAGSAGDRVATEQVGGHTAREAQAAALGTARKSGQTYGAMQQAIARSEVMKQGPVSRAVSRALGGAQVQAKKDLFDGTAEAAANGLMDTIKGGFDLKQWITGGSSIEAGSSIDIKTMDADGNITASSITAPASGNLADLSRADKSKLENYAALMDDEIRQQAREDGAMIELKAEQAKTQLALMDPTGSLALQFYGDKDNPGKIPSRREILERAKQKEADAMFTTMGLDPSKLINFHPDDAINLQMNEIYRETLYRTAKGYEAHHRGEFMGVAGIGLSGLFSGPYGAYGAWRGMLLSADGAATQNRTGYEIVRKQRQVMHQLMSTHNTMLKENMMYDPRFIEANLLSAGVSKDRGGEWFSIDMFPESAVMDLQDIQFRSEQDFKRAFQRGRIQAGRWIFEPVVPISYGY
jgi:hypothetical protein